MSASAIAAADGAKEYDEQKVAAEATAAEKSEVVAKESEETQGRQTQKKQKMQKIHSQGQAQRRPTPSPLPGATKAHTRLGLWRGKSTQHSMNMVS